MKGVANPLLWLLAAQIACWWLARRRRGALARTASAVLLGSALLLWVLSTQQFSQALERFWSPPVANASDFWPAWFIVLAGGWRPGATPEEDYLDEETQRRVLHAVALWRRHPQAKLVMSGWSGEFGLLRDPARQVELMAGLAREKGVPPAAIVLEPRALNTFEHPIEVLKLPGIAKDAPLGVVTSGWHMRRAHAQFARHFGKVEPYPVASVRRLQNWEAWTPSAGALRDSVMVVHEMLGMGWYRLRAAFSA
jgi:uncharacterized SAM-binding protein YcdF (DUF218 family)